MAIFRHVRWFASYVVPLTCIVLLAGCGDGGGKATITGKVTADGMPVTAGSLLFTPTEEAGKAAEATVGQDGSFRAASNAAGKYIVTYTPPTPEATQDLQPGESPKPGPFSGLVPKESAVQVKGGANTVNVELTKPPMPAG